MAVPEEMAVVGFDGIDLGRFSVPSLTIFVDPFVEKGRCAAQILCDLGSREQRGGEEALPRRVGAVDVRESCGARQPVIVSG